MVRRVLFTILALVLAAAAFFGADPAPDVNLFGVVFLIFAFIVWFHWKEIQAGYAYHADSGDKGNAHIPLMVVRLGPMLIRELVVRKRRRA